MAKKTPFSEAQRRAYGAATAKADKRQMQTQGIALTEARTFRKALIAVACDLLNAEGKPRTDWKAAELERRHFDDAMRVCAELAGDTARADHFRDAVRRRLLFAYQQKAGRMGAGYAAQIMRDTTGKTDVATLTLPELRHLVMTLEQRRRGAARKAKASEPAA
mgnify:FL=1